MKYLIIALGAIFSLAFTTTENNTEMNTTNPIEQVTSDLHDIWALTAVGGSEIEKSIYTEGVPTLEINVTESRINGFSGCNSYFGSLIIEGSSVSFDNIGATKKYCMGIPEKPFFNSLGIVDSYKREGLVLTLMAGTEEVMTFKKVD